jgi:hypothetical protein
MIPTSVYLPSHSAYLFRNALIFSRNGPPYSASLCIHGVGSIGLSSPPHLDFERFDFDVDGASRRRRRRRRSLSSSSSSSSASASASSDVDAASSPSRPSSLSLSLVPDLPDADVDVDVDLSLPDSPDVDFRPVLALAPSFPPLRARVPSFPRELNLNPQFAGVSAPTTRPTNPRSRSTLPRPFPVLFLPLIDDSLAFVADDSLASVSATVPDDDVPDVPDDDDDVPDDDDVDAPLARVPTPPPTVDVDDIPPRRRARGTHGTTPTGTPSTTNAGTGDRDRDRSIDR